MRTLLVANRGEIARRIFRTCRDLGITTVAVHSDPDADAPFAREADLAVALGGASPAESYLRGDAIIAAAQQTGADAIHPGYGFLAEDAGFARAVIAAGLTWIGPEPETIDAMGSKVRARELMEAAGVPVLPGRTLDADPDEAALRGYADEIGYPLLVKASAGGGGRGMRRVDGPDGLVDAVASARHEADAAFGDGTVFLERYVTRPRHVEVQILGDRRGTVSALPERDCSIQRRHQKLIEESPAPAIGDDVRERLATAARDAARALRYVGAGTVEFVLAPDGDVFFLEVNTRLQVEHPVTELVCGLDLVALQVAVAEGAALPDEAVDPDAHGHAIEARIVAEDAAAGWRPQTGAVERFAFGDAEPTHPDGAACGTGAAGRGDGGSGHDAALGVSSQTTLRVDSAVDPGSVVSPHYDSMLAKVIVHAATREGAIRRLHAVLARGDVAGIRTNRDLLVRTLESDEFRTVTHDTQLLDGPRLDALAAPLVAGDALRWAAVAAALAAQAARRADATVAATVPSGWRNVPAAPQTVTYRVQSSDDVLVVGYRLGRTGGLAELSADGARSTPDPSDDGASSSVDSSVDGGPRATEPVVGDSPTVELVRASATEVVLRIGGVRRRFTVHAGHDAVWVGDGRGQVALVEQPRFPDPGVQAAAGSLDAPLPGTVLRVDVAAGDAVALGQRLLVLEAMKMEHEVTATCAGTVTAVHVAVGDAVDGGQTLLVVQSDDGGEAA
ncbi:MAG: ATP-grasp domain-containing protein [Patulibacter sp.]|nr:ATP-grasp domain-containing protein [Patulibacter sp.]